MQLSIREVGVTSILWHVEVYFAVTRSAVLCSAMTFCKTNPKFEEELVVSQAPCYQLLGTAAGWCRQQLIRGSIAIPTGAH